MSAGGFEQVSRFVQTILPMRGRARRFLVPGSNAEIVINLETWFGTTWNVGAYFTIVSNVDLYIQAHSAASGTTSHTAEVDLTGTPSADDTQMDFYPSGVRYPFILQPCSLDARTPAQQYLHVRGSSAGSLWIACTSHQIG